MNTMVKRGCEYPAVLRDARRGRGLTQGDLAALLGVKASTVCGWERGRCTPSPCYWDDLERVLGVAPSIFELYDASEIASMVKGARISLGITKKHLARLAAVDDCTIARVERVGRCQASVLACIVRALAHVARLRDKEGLVPDELVGIAKTRLRNWSMGRKVS